jgi:uncharacterized membrane-anchored protein
MKLSGLLSRHEPPLPGVVGIAKVEGRPGDLLRRVRRGDVVVLDQTDMDHRTAEALVAAGVVGVVNAARSISGRFPNLGPDVLLSAGIVLIDEVGTEVLYKVKDGTHLRLHEGGVFADEQEIARGHHQDAGTIADQLIEAKAGMTAQLEAFSADTIEFLRHERLLMLDGVGVPQMTVPMRDRHVVVVAPGSSHRADLERLHRYVKDYHPVLVGVGAAADTMCEVGCPPHIIVGDPDGMYRETLECGAEVVVPTEVDGYAPGLDRAVGLGIPAVTFPASCNAEDLALLLADVHGARMVVTVGFGATLLEFLDGGRTGSMPSTFLTRLRLGAKLVDGRAVAALRRDSGKAVGSVVLPVLALVLVVFVTAWTSGLGTAYTPPLLRAMGSLAAYFKGIFA